ncbi:protein yippee-like 2 isoform X1 [Scyliorhinus canicula]|uniref:protein yippee-like 2 isoform X1 n=1 Tax=Scyliorhinus canicula TaxID=7830 RepID=UPI0018F752B2|nr:protein yippee-like 2 isoform X1 [Scyliorhinus canicula]
MVKMTRSKTFQAYLPTCHRTYSCIHCRAHLANHDELISKSFQGSQGRAYLFNSVVNVGCGPAEERVLLTGLHAVADIYCENCKTTLGWKYSRFRMSTSSVNCSSEIHAGDVFMLKVWCLQGSDLSPSADFNLPEQHRKIPCRNNPNGTC